jgi:hypothetical protein
MKKKTYQAQKASEVQKQKTSRESPAFNDGIMN